MASTVCGCWYSWPPQSYQKQYFAQVALTSRTTILSSTSRTVLTQTFRNPQGNAVHEAHYDFPLYDGVTVVAFKCTVGQRKIIGVVKEKQQARSEFSEAVKSGQTAGLFEQLAEASDVFTTKLGNIPESESIVVEIVYLGELKQDIETDGVRFTIPSKIAPRYGPVPIPVTSMLMNTTNVGGIDIVVDVVVESGSIIRGIQSPSHPIAVKMGRNSLQDESVFQNNHASASLALTGKTELDQDFVVIVNAQGQDTPRAFIETHPAHGRALMTTLVPKFNLPNAHPEIIFVVDRSGSMDGSMHLVVQALKVFLKSLPLSVKFNICSFGSSHSFLFDKSKAYDESNLQSAFSYVESFTANFGGTELQAPIEACVHNRLHGQPLEMMVLTDGRIWNQQALFDFINKASKHEARVFSLGIGSGASTSLVEGMARAGNGFAQFVKDGETIDKRVVRMLKAALTPHITDYSLEVRYTVDHNELEEDFEMVESITDSVKNVAADDAKPRTEPISLFDQGFKEAPTDSGAGRYDHLPVIDIPAIIQTPHRIPALYAFDRTTVCLILGPTSSHKTIESVVLRATSAHGPLLLEIPVDDIGQGETIHQLAAKKVTQELEEGRGWLIDAKSADGSLLKEQQEGDWERIVEREAVRIGTQFQVAGKYCSFVAVETQDNSMEAGKILSVVSIPAVPLRSVGPLPAFPMRCSTSINPHASAAATAGFGRVSHQALPSATRPHYDKLFSLQQINMYSNSPSKFGSTSGGSGGLFGNHFGPSPVLSSPAPSAPPTSSSTSVPFCMSPPAAASAKSSSLFGGMVANQMSNNISGASLGRRGSCAGSLTSSAFGSSRGQSPETQPDLRNTTMEQRMHCVIGLQEFDGSWKRIDQLLKVISIDSKPYNLGVSRYVNDMDVNTTALAIAWLEANVPKLKDIWFMVADKARGWLVMQPGIIDAKPLVESMRTTFFPDSNAH